eukprot:GHRQ01017828.1.p2 GENE.GHRQ01017828.1~~GHRQ01017828.1.p2  ORF type:complete len:122 (-),score=20.96 GHRQ01017828.1:87-452(-)
MMAFAANMMRSCKQLGSGLHAVSQVATNASSLTFCFISVWQQTCEACWQRCIGTPLVAVLTAANGIMFVKRCAAVPAHLATQQSSSMLDGSQIERRRCGQPQHCAGIAGGCHAMSGVWRAV